MVWGPARDTGPHPQELGPLDQDCGPAEAEQEYDSARDLFPGIEAGVGFSMVRSGGGGWRL